MENRSRNTVLLVIITALVSFGLTYLLLKSKNVSEVSKDLERVQKYDSIIEAKDAEYTRTVNVLHSRLDSVKASRETWQAEAVRIKKEYTKVAYKYEHLKNEIEDTPDSSQFAITERLLAEYGR